MAVNFFRGGARWARVGLETMAIVSSLVLLAVLLLAGRLAHRPLDVGFARPYIERALSNSDEGISVAVDDLVLAWPHFEGPLQLDVRNLSVIRKGKVEATVAHVQLGLSRVMLLAGRVAPVRIQLTRPSLRLVRDHDNRVTFRLNPPDSGSVPAATPDGSDTLTHVLGQLAQQRKLFDFQNPLAHLRSIEINDATMVMEDHVLGVTWYLGHMNLTFAHDPQGLVMSSAIRIPGGRNGEATIFANAVYRRNSNDYAVTLNLNDFDPRIISRKADALSALNEQEIYLNGGVSAQLESDLKVKVAQANLTAGAGSLTIPSLYSRPLPFQSLMLDASYKREDKAVNVSALKIVAGGVTVTAAAGIGYRDGVIGGPVLAQVPHATQAQIAALWPDRLQGGAQTWLTKKMSRGSLDNIAASLILNVGLPPQHDWTVAASNVKADFDIKDMTIDYRAPLWPATGAHGHGHFENGLLDIAIDGAMIGSMTATRGHVLIDRIGEAAAAGLVKISLHINGALATAFGFAASPPINLNAQKIGMDISAVRGTADVDVGVSFPAIKNLLATQVVVTVNGPLHDVILPHVIKDMDLTGKTFDLSVAEGGVLLRGSGALAGMPLDFSWRKFVTAAGRPYDSQVTVSLTTDDALRTRLNLGLDAYLHGPAPAQVIYTDFGNGRAEAAVNADLKPTHLMSTTVGYDKAPDAPGAVKAKVVFDHGVVRSIEDIDLHAPSLSVAGAQLTLAKNDDKTVIRDAALGHIVLNDTDATVHATTGTDGVVTVTVRGAAFDARAFLRHGKRGEPYAGPPIVATIAVDRLRPRDGFLLTGVTADLTINAQGQMDRLSFDGIAGKGPIVARLQPGATAGGNILNMKAEDAGYALKAFSIYDNIVGGTMTLVGRSTAEAPHNIIGHAAISDFRLINAPVLARIINALSLTSLPALLTGEGLHFSVLEADFKWLATPQGDIYLIHDGRTAGASIGLTFSGTVDRPKDSVNVNGDVVPLSGVNGLLNGVPLVNLIVTGGNSSGIFAATYAITGPVDNPQVSVNPLSVLAPGILRRILFE